jgi:hypothetical protein
MEVVMDLPFDDKRDNPEGAGRLSSDIEGLWKPLAFIERLPNIFVKVYKVSCRIFLLFACLYLILKFRCYFFLIQHSDATSIR